MAEWATRRRPVEQMRIEGMQKSASARTLAGLMMVGRDHLTKIDTVTVTAIEAGVPQLPAAWMLMERSRATLQTEVATYLDTWIEQVMVSLIAPPAIGVT